MQYPARKGEPLAGHQRYQKIRDLNQGTFGFVQLAWDKETEQQVAIKFIERGDKVTKYVQREILNHRRLLHPHVVEMREVFLTPAYLAIAMEFAAGGDMFHWVGRHRGLCEDDSRWYFQQLTLGMDYCHRMGVANRDIKLENALLDGNEKPLLKICDFGYSKHEKLQSAPGTRVGTPAYLAPEVILTTKGKTYDGKTADVWSCGVMLFIMLTASYPFGRPEDDKLKPAKKMHNMLQRILNVDYQWPSHVAVSQECKHLLERILVADPAQRMTIPQILQHPWFRCNLPPGVATMNDRLVPQEGQEFELPPGIQSMEDTERVVQEAMTPIAPQGPIVKFDNDDLIDDVMDCQRGTDSTLIADEY